MKKIILGIIMYTILCASCTKGSHELFLRDGVWYSADGSTQLTIGTKPIEQINGKIILTFGSEKRYYTILSVHNTSAVVKYQNGDIINLIQRTRVLSLY